MQQARRLVRIPMRVDAGTALEQESSDVDNVVRDGQGQRRVEDLLRARPIPSQVAARSRGCTG
jgi:hypothetical protein